MTTALIVILCIVGYVGMGITVGRIIFNHYITIEYNKQIKLYIYKSDLDKYGSKEAAAYANAKLHSDADAGATLLGAFWPITGLWLALYLEFGKRISGKTIRLLPNNHIQKRIAEIEEEKEELETLQKAIEDARKLNLNVKGLEDIVKSRSTKN